MTPRERELAGVVTDLVKEIDMQDLTCANPVCDEAAPPKTPTGPRALYCSKLCRSRASYLRLKETITRERRDANAAIRAATIRRCSQCGGDFAPMKSLRQIYCSKSCLGKATRDTRSKTCSESDCDRSVRAKGLCAKHYKAVRRAQGLRKPDAWTDARRAQWKARYALTRGALDAEVFSCRAIYERDGWMCGICGDSVDPELAWPDPMSVSLDHVIPVSRGGKHSRANTQCSHFRCNARKGATV